MEDAGQAVHGVRGRDGAEVSDIYPSKLQRADIKDLSKGMVSTKPTTLTPPGAFLDVMNFNVTTTGLQRRNGWKAMGTTKDDYGRIPISLAGDEVVNDIETIFDVDNNLQLVAFTNKRMYVNATGDEFVPVSFGRAHYVATTVAGQRINVTLIGGGAADMTVDRVRTGDVVWYHDGSNDSESSVTTVGTTYFEAVAVPVWVGAGTEIHIIREFDLQGAYNVDYTIIPKGLAMVDGSDRGVWKYDGTCLSDMKVKGSAADIAAGDGGYLLGAKSIYFFAGYLMLGNTVEDYSDPADNNYFDQKRTLRWSSVTDITEFTIADYVLFTRETSEIVKVTASEECPVVFLTNAIYFGTLSDLGGLPYKYARVESGAVSAVGQRAMCSVPGGMVFVGQKNVYFLELARQGTRVPVLVPMADNVFNRLCMTNQSPAYTRAFFSPQENSLICSSPQAKNRLGELYYLSMETKSWSRVSDPSKRFTTGNTFPYYQLVRWMDGDLTPWSDYDVYSWLQFKLEDYTTRLFAVDTNGFVYASDNETDDDEVLDIGTGLSTVPFTCVVESGDMDYGSVGIYKILTQMIFTLGEVPTKVRTRDVGVTVEISVDRGKSWEDKGSILIEAGTFVEDMHLRATGEVIRYRVTFEEGAPLFVFSEHELRFRVAGAFNQRGP